jgi:hypothetical protein
MATEFGAERRTPTSESCQRADSAIRASGRSPGMSKKPLACRVFGHRWRFRRDGATLSWSCGRGCDVGGARTYESAAEAEGYLRHFDRAPGPPTSFIAAIGGTVERRAQRRDQRPSA